jgi:preprotein translocase subunit SecF
MMFGVVLVGTYTSIFIAAPILIYLGVGTHRADAPDVPVAKKDAPAIKPDTPARKPETPPKKQGAPAKK